MKKPEIRSQEEMDEAAGIVDEVLETMEVLSEEKPAILQKI